MNRNILNLICLGVLLLGSKVLIGEKFSDKLEQSEKSIQDRIREHIEVYETYSSEQPELANKFLSRFEIKEAIKGYFESLAAQLLRGQENVDALQLFDIANTPDVALIEYIFDRSIYSDAIHLIILEVFSFQNQLTDKKLQPYQNQQLENLKTKIAQAESMQKQNALQGWDSGRFIRKLLLNRLEYIFLRHRLSSLESKADNDAGTEILREFFGHSYKSLNQDLIYLCMNNSEKRDEKFFNYALGSRDVMVGIETLFRQHCEVRDSESFKLWLSDLLPYFSLLHLNDTRVLEQAMALNPQFASLPSVSYLKPYLPLILNHAFGHEKVKEIARANSVYLASAEKFYLAHLNYLSKLKDISDEKISEAMNTYLIVADLRIRDLLMSPEFVSTLQPIFKNYAKYLRLALAKTNGLALDSFFENLSNLSDGYNRLIHDFPNIKTMWPITHASIMMKGLSVANHGLSLFASSQKQSNEHESLIKEKSQIMAQQFFRQIKEVIAMEIPELEIPIESIPRQANGFSIIVDMIYTNYSFDNEANDVIFTQFADLIIAAYQFSENKEDLLSIMRYMAKTYVKQDNIKRFREIFQSLVNSNFKDESQKIGQLLRDFGEGFSSCFSSCTFSRKDQKKLAKLKKLSCAKQKVMSEPNKRKGSRATSTLPANMILEFRKKQAAKKREEKEKANAVPVKKVKVNKINKSPPVQVEDLVHPIFVEPAESTSGRSFATNEKPEKIKTRGVAMPRLPVEQEWGEDDEDQNEGERDLQSFDEADGEQSFVFDNIKFSKVVRTVDNELEQSKPKLTRQQVIDYFSALGCQLNTKGGKGVHQKIVYNGEPSFGIQDNELSTDPRSDSVLEGMGFGALILPDWTGKSMPRYLTEEIRKARSKILRARQNKEGAKINFRLNQQPTKK